MRSATIFSMARSGTASRAPGTPQEHVPEEEGDDHQNRVEREALGQEHGRDRLTLSDMDQQIQAPPA